MTVGDSNGLSSHNCLHVDVAPAHLFGFVKLAILARRSSGNDRRPLPAAIWAWFLLKATYLSKYAKNAGDLIGARDARIG